MKLVFFSDDVMDLNLGNVYFKSLFYIMFILKVLSRIN